MQKAEVKADTFMELLAKLETWKLDNDNYDYLSIAIVKRTNEPEYYANLLWQPSEEIK